MIDLTKSSQSLEQTQTEMAKYLCNFINRSPSPFHVVDNCKKQLLSNGYTELIESQRWHLEPNGKYFVTRNASTVVAFAIGGKWRPGNGFSIIGAHTDSPCLRLKPVSERSGAGKVQQVGVQPYGGGIWHTWFDRDLTAAGRVIVREGASLVERLVNIEKPIMKVCSLAIHLDRSVNDSFSVNKEKHMSPILCRQLADAVNKTAGQEKHHPEFLSLVAEKVNCSPGDIVDWEMYIADTQPAHVWGLREEFVSAPRLDNLHSCYAGLEAIISAGNLENDSCCRVLSLYDHEEIGSKSAQGADSAFTDHILRRICLSNGASGNGGDASSPTAMQEAMPKSMLVSADVSHAVHPNYSDRHEVNHSVTLFDGVVIKENANQRYATNLRTKAVLSECLSAANKQTGASTEINKLQDFIIKQDLACGSTIGPLVAANLAMPTIDVGAPVLGMHSCRETTSVCSVNQSVHLFTAFYEKFDAVMNAFTCENQ